MIIIISLLIVLPLVSGPFIYPSTRRDSASHRLRSSEYVDIFGATSVYQRYKHRHKILILGGNRSCDIELFTLLSVLSKAGISARFAGLVPKQDENVISTMYNLKVKPNVRLTDLTRELPYEMIVIPGGQAYKWVLFKEHVQKIVIDQDKNFRYLAAMSTGVLAFAINEIGFGKHVSFPPVISQTLQSQYYTNNIGVVHDGHILSSKGPLAAMEFSLYIVELFLGREEANKVADKIGYKRNLGDIKIVKPFKN